nr:AFaDin (actin filament binding protein) [Hymenolepis microstoma]
MDSKFAPTNSRLPLKSFGLNPSEINIDKLARKAGVLPATVNRVMLQKNGQPLGIGIVAAKPEGNVPYGIYIRHIVPESVAAQDGRLEYGDQILAIANSSLVNCDQSETAVAILARITNTVNLVVAKRAAQARGIINLINSAQSGRPLPNPMSRSNVSLNRTTSLNQVNIDDIDDDEDDDSEDGGARFGSKMSLGNSVSQNSIFPPRRTEMFSAARGDNQPGMREFDVSSEEITSEEGSDEVWQPNEKPLNPNRKVSNERPSPPNESHSFQPSPASVQGSLDNYKFRSQQDLRSAGHSAGISSATGDTIQGSSDWNEVARHNAEVMDNSENREISPTLSSLSSAKSIDTQEERRGPLNISKPLQEGVYTNPSEMTSDSDDLLTSVKQQIPSGNRVNTAEKNTSPLNMSPAKSVTDKAMQTIIETTNMVEEMEIKKSASQVSLQASAVQTEPLRSFQISEQISTYTPPLNRLPMIRHPDTSQISSTPNPPVTGRVQVEDVTKANNNPYVGRFQQQQPRLSSRSFPKVEILTTSSSYSDLRMPYSTASVNTDGRVEPSTIQSGVTYWSSQTDLAYAEASPPPEPTADFPQYHPPERLEPSELAIKFGDVGTPKRYQKERSPTSPSAQLSVFGPPASRYIPERNNSRDTSPLRIDLIQKSRELTTSNQMLRSSSLNRVGHQEPVDNQSRQLQELSGEIRRLEDAVAANPNVDLVRDLDRLRVEYRFQLQLNDRSRTRSLTAPYMRSPDLASSRQPSSSATPSNASVNRPMVPNISSINGSKTKPVEDYANERLEVIRMQEQRTRLYEESFNSKPDSDYKTNKRIFASSPPPSVPPMQPKYTYQVESGPLYDEITSISATPITPRYAQTIRQSSPSAANSFSEHRESSLSRGTELRASRKSVTFDTNLESVTLYSPHSTPPDKSTGKIDQTRRPVVRAENQQIARIYQQPTDVKRDFGFKSGATQPENAENLSFKDKMAFFAKAIGDEMPKDRFKASQKERQIMNSLAR